MKSRSLVQVSCSCKEMYFSNGGGASRLGDTFHFSHRPCVTINGRLIEHNSRSDIRSIYFCKCSAISFPIEYPKAITFEGMDTTLIHTLEKCDSPKDFRITFDPDNHVISETCTFDQANFNAMLKRSMN